VFDQFGNLVTNFSGMVALSLNDNPMTGATLSGTLTVKVVNGVATFSDLSIDLAGTGYTLHARIGGAAGHRLQPFQHHVGTRCPSSAPARLK
jgi:hypothetical protein